jgi:hypothetical protein
VIDAYVIDAVEALVIERKLIANPHAASSAAGSNYRHRASSPNDTHTPRSNQTISHSKPSNHGVLHQQENSVPLFLTKRVEVLDSRYQLHTTVWSTKQVNFTCQTNKQNAEPSVSYCTTRKRSGNSNIARDPTHNQIRQESC